MKANYHTHTYRCHHSLGCEWEYAEAAIAAGFEALGFSDHAPLIFPHGFCSTYRMEPNRLRDYVETVWKLKRLYEGKIEIRCGLEAEYYPELARQQFDLLDDPDSGIEYLILGQHFLQNEYDDEWYTASPTDSEARLAQYVDQVIAGMATRRYRYLCHPDILHFTGAEAIYYKHMKRLCEAAKELNMPLELNGQGLRYKKGYPRDDFFAIAGAVGNTVILGADAHEVGALNDQTDALLGFVKRHKLTLLEKLEF